MADLSSRRLRVFENPTAHTTHDPDSRYPGEDIDPVDAYGDGSLDGPMAEALLIKIFDWWDQARQLQAENREEQSIDWDFYDGLQWSDDDVATLTERNQAPYVFNLIKPACDWIIGTEKRTRMDYRVLGRRNDDISRRDGENKTKLMKYLNDVNDGGFSRSQAFAETTKCGVGWLEDGARNDESDEVLFTRYESWRNIWYDSLSIERDLSDARFLFRAKWADVDYLNAMFPDRERQIRESARAQLTLVGDDEMDDFWYARAMTSSREGNIVRRSWVDGTGSIMNQRERVRPVECWYRMPTKVQKMRGFDEGLEGRIFSPYKPEHVTAVEEEIVSLHDAVVEEMHCAIFVGKYLLQNTKSPYYHNDFPFTPIWAYRRGRDNAPYGTVRNSRDPQEDHNKRAAKAIYILSTNQVMAEEGAVETDKWDSVIAASNDPAGVIRLKNGALQNNRFQIRQDNKLAEEHLMLMDRDEAMIRNASGVQGESLGEETNAISGKAIIAKQNESSVVNFELFDNLRYAMQLQGRKQLSLIEQFYDMPKTIRLVGDRGKLEYLPLNEPEWNEVEGRYVFLNDITARQADFVIDQQDFRATVRQAMFDQLMDMMSKLDTEIVLQLLDLVIDMSELPEKEELVKRIRKINGQSDPDEEEDPEIQAAKAQQDQKQQEMERIQLRDLLSTIMEREAKTAKTNVESQEAALQAALSVSGVPEVTPVADVILETAGFQDPSGAPAETMAPVAPAAPAAPTAPAALQPPPEAIPQ